MGAALFLALAYEIGGGTEAYVRASKSDLAAVIDEGIKQGKNGVQIAEAILRYLEFKARTK